MRGNKPALSGYNALTQAVSQRKNLVNSARSGRLTDGDTRTIDRYMKMHKVLVGQCGAMALADMAERLGKSTSESAHLHYVRGWMLSEASLAGSESFSLSDRTAMLSEAEKSFDRSLWLGVSRRLDKNPYSDRNYRVALAMAHLPLMQAMVDGDVTTDIEHEVTADVLAINNSVCKYSANLSGLANELSILSLLHLMDDPKYVALPSTYRGDSGVHNKPQTHDIVSIKQHFGEIRQIQPIEVKTHVSDEMRSRYWTTLVASEKVTGDLSDRNSRKRFNRAVEAVFYDKASEEQSVVVETARLCLVATLKKYAQTGRPVGGVMNTPTKFYGRNQFVAA